MYVNDYKLIVKFVNKSPYPFWIRKVLLNDGEFLHDAQLAIDLYRLFPKKHHLKVEIKKIIKQYAKEALLTQLYIKNGKFSKRTTMKMLASRIEKSDYLKEDEWE